MRWSILVCVAAAALTVMAGGVGACSGMLLVDQGYEDVVVGISSSLPESQAEEIIAAVKVAVTDASHALFKATGNRLFFRRVKVLIPTAWKSVTPDQAATNEVFALSHMRVDVRSGVYGDQAYTVQPGGCGEPGLYIHLTPTFLTDPEAENEWGPRGKVLVREWAKLRWGVFDEVGYLKDPRSPLVYVDRNEEGFLDVKSNHCTDEKIEGKFIDGRNQGSCSYLNFQLQYCRFEPDEQQTATSSLMSYTNLPSIEEFCGEVKGEDAGVRHHNTFSSSRHNVMCTKKSVWQVMSDHQDFNSTTRLPADHPVTPEVVVVQQMDATFALVMDYSRSMEGKKINVLATTAKRWLLHDVGDGSFVTLIKFSNVAQVMKPLTRVSKSTRQELANAVTTNVDGSTSIGSGLLAALDQLKNKINKVILLITDGDENAAPLIADVMNTVVESHARVVTISYGKAADLKLESLAQNTCGRTYIVPDNDDGSFMNDAFQSSITYQPGQLITDTRIKIHESSRAVQGPDVINGTFPVDATLGGNLEFRLDSEVYIPENPYLTSPNNLKFKNVEFHSDTNLWTIKVDNVLTELGTWSWTMPISTVTTNIKVTVTAKARDTQTLPIITESWINTGSDYVDGSKQPVIVYASVKQGQNPVVGAKVRAYITTPNPTTPAVELDLLDDGNSADVQAGDGIYSRYFTQFVSSGRYAVKAQVWDEGSSFINNGFITSRRRRRRSVHNHLALSQLMPRDQLVVPEYCCGSVVPFNRETATPTGNFTRVAAAGSFHLKKMPESGDTFSPSQIKDLSVDIQDSLTLTLRWTAPGDDYDTGTVFGYEIWMSENPNDLNDNLELNTTINLLDLDRSSNMPELLKEAGEEVTFHSHLQEPMKPDTLYFLALRAMDEAGNRSPMSWPVRYMIVASGAHSHVSLSPWIVILFASVVF